MESGRLKIEAVVRRVDAVTPRVRLYELGPRGEENFPPFTAGAHIDVQLPNGMIRSFSLLNDPRERDRYEIAVLREDDGRGGSRHMHDALAVGDVLTLAPPLNLFELDEGGDHHILIAGGIGITPISAMAARLDELGLDFVLYYLARNRAEAAFADRLERAYGDRVRLHHSRQEVAERLDVAELLRVRAPGTHVYVCGPPGLIANVRTASKEWPQGTVHFELFGNTNHDAFATNRAFDVHLKRRGKTLHVPADRSILDVLTDEGIRIRTVCRDGFCGTCTQRYLAGGVEHRDGVLDEEARATQLQVCVSRARPGPTLVLDL